MKFPVDLSLMSAINAVEPHHTVNVSVGGSINGAYGVASNKNIKSTLKY